MENERAGSALYEDGPSSSWEKFKLARLDNTPNYWAGMWSKKMKEAVKCITPCVVSIPMQLEMAGQEEEAQTTEEAGAERGLTLFNE